MKPKLKKNIFIVVGNGKFDPLIKKIDQLKSERKIEENIIAQIGHGKYQPKNYFF